MDRVVHVSLQAVPAFVGDRVSSRLFQGGFVHCLKWFRDTAQAAAGLASRRVPSRSRRSVLPDSRQNRLSCASCCAALSLRIAPINESAGSETAGKGTADDRHPSELSSTCRVYRGRWPDRFGDLDRSL